MKPDFGSIESRLSREEVEERREAVVELSGEPSGPEDSGERIRLLIKALQDPSWRVRKTAQDILLSTYQIDAYIEALIGLLYIEDNAGARNSAIETLAVLDKKSTPYLIESFKTENNDVRKFIIDVLGSFRDPRAIPLLLGALKDEDENVRASAVEHLGVLGEPSVVDAIVEILESGDLWTAYPAADALGRIGDPRGLPALIGALGSRALREPSLKAIGMLGSAEALEHIVPFLKDKSKTVQEETLRTIEALYDKGVEEERIAGEIRKAFGEEAVDILVKHAWNPKPDVRSAAILLLGLLKDEHALEPLLDLSIEDEYADIVKRALVFIGREKPEILLPLLDNESVPLRRFICTVVAEVADRTYYEKLMAFLEDEDGHVRAQAALGLSNMGDLRAVPAIRGLMADQYVDVQEAAVRALVKLSEGLGLDDLLSDLRSGDPALRKNAASLMGRLKIGDAVSALGFALKDERVEVRRAVIGALAEIKTEESMRYLNLALTDEDPEIRAAAALSLGQMDGADTLERLWLLLADPDDMVRVASVKALGQSGRREAVPALVGMLKDENGFVVASAVDSLGGLGGTEARDALVGMLSSEDTEIRRTAIMGLSGFDDIEEAIAPFLRDSDWATRMAAIEVLGSRRPGAGLREELERLYDEEEDPVVKRALEQAINV